MADKTTNPEFDPYEIINDDNYHVAKVFEIKKRVSMIINSNEQVNIPRLSTMLNEYNKLLRDKNIKNKVEEAIEMSKKENEKKE